MSKQFIVVAGNMGVGKSTLTGLLAERLGWRPFYEAVDENPYIGDFFADMPRWAFHSQMFFLGRRLQQHKAVMQHSGSALMDRSIYEDAEIFARNLHDRGTISRRDWGVYETFYRGLCELLTPPTLVIYLKSSIPMLLKRIAQRGRDYERSLSIDYLMSLNNAYDRWAAQFALSPVHTIEIDEVDFLENPSDFERLVMWLKTQGYDT
ncbi:MAG: deoxynucleoside kinase [Anaerolineae bacterium]|nr:deoxynucleoside kinase [Anaerolineae bacterium]